MLQIMELWKEVRKKQGSSEDCVMNALATRLPEFNQDPNSSSNTDTIHLLMKQIMELWKSCREPMAELARIQRRVQRLLGTAESHTDDRQSQVFKYLSYISSTFPKGAADNTHESLVAVDTYFSNSLPETRENENEQVHKYKMRYGRTGTCGRMSALAVRRWSFIHTLYIFFIFVLKYKVN
ncbi:unnamed protein product [Cylicocyclus nassatus]|uniref:Uncharacterized protein n=1 Tax=Cylicocyclus nassatus TaxID=53992 RepID=A0AA36MEP4_CYLNA|nr:unnamed protein product [Cylicocyclus nassatus]